MSSHSEALPSREPDPAVRQQLLRSQRRARLALRVLKVGGAAAVLLSVFAAWDYARRFDHASAMQQLGVVALTVVGFGVSYGFVALVQRRLIRRQLQADRRRIIDRGRLDL